MKKIISNQTLFLCFLLLLGCSDCNARKSKKQSFMKEIISPILKDSLGDSLCSIIIDAERIKVKRLSTKTDSLEKNSTKWLSKREMGIASFLIIANSNYSHPSLVYGKYSPNVSFTFYSKKGHIDVEIDFGLKRMCFHGEKAVFLDINEDYLLKLCNMLFPNDKYLSFILKEITK